MLRRRGPLPLGVRHSHDDNAISLPWPPHPSEKRGCSVPSSCAVASPPSSPCLSPCPLPAFKSRTGRPRTHFARAEGGRLLDLGPALLQIGGGGRLPGCNRLRKRQPAPRQTPFPAARTAPAARGLPSIAADRLPD